MFAGPEGGGGDAEGQAGAGQGRQRSHVRHGGRRARPQHSRRVPGRLPGHPTGAVASCSMPVEIGAGAVSVMMAGGQPKQARQQPAQADGWRNAQPQTFDVVRVRCGNVGSSAARGPGAEEQTALWKR